MLPRSAAMAWLDVLDPAKLWWEDTKLGERILRLLVFRHGATLAALICEDLARTDPAQALLRSLGPNLVIALLMDGPQVQARWPGQYATVLADDPWVFGSHVDVAGNDPPCALWRAAERWLAGRLWKEYGKHPADEVKLQDDAHAILATLFVKTGEETTLDRRTDGGTSMHVSLGQWRQIRHPSPPDWIKHLCADDS